MAEGDTLIDRIYHIDRGYECIEEKKCNSLVRKSVEYRASFMLTIALSKGRILDDTLPLLEQAGIVPTENPEKKAVS